MLIYQDIFHALDQLPLEPPVLTGFFAAPLDLLEGLAINFEPLAEKLFFADFDPALPAFLSLM